MSRFTSIMFFAIVFSIISGLGSNASSFHEFCSAPAAPIEIMICYDPIVSSLDDEMSILYFDYHDNEPPDDQGDILQKQTSWLKLRNEKCNIPTSGGLSGKEALQSRECLILLYKERISQLSQLSNLQVNRLHDRPDDLSDATSYFTMVSSRDSLSKAKNELSRLQSTFPFERFDLYPPYGDGTFWAVVIASYTDEESALDARRLAVASAIADDSFVWGLPKPLASVRDWRPLREGEPEPLAGTARKIISCYSKTRCPGIEVQLFEQCMNVLGSGLRRACPALPDTVEGRAILHANLDDAKLTMNSELVLTADTLPVLPTATALTECKSGNTTDGEYVKCVTTNMSTKYKPILDCFSKFTEGERLACFAAQVGNKDFTAIIGCLGGGTPSPDTIAMCTSTPDSENQITNISNCVADAASGQVAQSCLANEFPPEQRTIINCLGTGTGASDPAACLDATL
jgi:uncharacterized protein YecT (DUF1311 family)